MSARRKKDGPEPPRSELGGAGRVVAGRYRLGRVLGQGGMGVVYEARALDARRIVAIKLLLPTAAARPDVVTRFEREARAAAAIGHPGIVRVLEVGRSELGECFIAMERLRGTSLGALLRGVPPPSMERVRDALVQVLDALEAAHAKGIVHRDIKPENVFVTVPRGSRIAGTAAAERVVVLDFGVSKMAGAVTLTGEGHLVGTPLFMSPEQILGTGELGPRADVYSVGVILYHALSGRFPYEGSSLGGLIAAVMNGEPRPIERVVPGIAPGWRDLLSRAVTRAPEDRFGSAGEMRAALEALPAALLEGTTAAAAIAEGPTPLVAGPPSARE